MKNILTLITLLILSLDAFAASTEPLVVYPKQKLIFLDTTASGANVSTDQTSFPIAVHVNTSSWPTAADRDNLFDNTNGTGKRINFYVPGETNSGQGLSYEVDLFDNTEDSENGIWWVNVPTVKGSSSSDSGTADADSTALVIEDDGQGWTTNQWQNWCVKMTSGATSGQIALIYSNDADTLTLSSALSAEADDDGFIIGSCLIVAYGIDVGSDQDNPTGTWNANYVMVQHLGNNTWGASPEAKDSTSGDNDGTNTGTDEVASCYVGACRDWVSTNSDYISLSDSGDNHVWDAVSTAFTVSMMYQPDTTDNQTMVGKDPGSGSTNRFLYFSLISSKLYAAILNSNGSVNAGGAATSTLSADTWYHVGVKYNSSVGRSFYVNGVADGTSTTKPTITPSNAQNTYIGKLSTDSYTNGYIDELRLSKSARSDDWMKLEYYSMKKTNYNGDSFVSFGSEEYVTVTTIEEYFFDTERILSVSGISFGVTTPIRYVGNPVYGDESWTWDNGVDYFSALENSSWDADSRIRIWAGVSSVDYDFDDVDEIYNTYSYSANGITFTKPNIGRITYGGSSNNNIIQAKGNFGGRVIYIDHAHPYWMLNEIREYGISPYIYTGIFLYYSDNPEGPFTYSTDLASLVSSGGGYYGPEAMDIVELPDGKKLISYQQQHDVVGGVVRDTGFLLSDTTDPAGTWSNLGLKIFGTGMDDQAHGCMFLTVGPILLGLVQHFDSTDTANSYFGTMGTSLYVSRNGETWSLKQEDWFTPSGGSAWDADWATISSTSSEPYGNRQRLYYTGCNYAATEEDALPGGCKIGIATVPIGRIGYVTASSGTITLAPTASTGSLYLNASANGGSIKTELLDCDGTPITGYEDTDSNVLTGDSYRFKVAWGSNLTMPVGCKRVKIYLTDATLYSVTEYPVYDAVLPRHGFINYQNPGIN